MHWLLLFTTVLLAIHLALLVVDIAAQTFASIPNRAVRKWTVILIAILLATPLCLVVVALGTFHSDTIGEKVRHLITPLENSTRTH